MFSRLLSLVILTTAVAAASAAPVPKGTPDPVYFPNQAGARWVYVDEPEGEMRLVASAVKPAGEKSYVVTVELEFGKGRLAPFQTVEVSPTGLAIVSEQNQPYTTAWRILRLPHRPDGKWETTAARDIGGGLTLNLRGSMTDLEAEEVRVPAGMYKAVRVECERVRDGRPMPTLTRWFAPGVGIVKEEHRPLEGGKPVRVRVLKSFTPGKG